MVDKNMKKRKGRGRKFIKIRVRDIEVIEPYAALSGVITYSATKNGYILDPYDIRDSGIPSATSSKTYTRWLNTYGFESTKPFFLYIIKAEMDAAAAIAPGEITVASDTLESVVIEAEPTVSKWEVIGSCKSQWSPDGTRPHRATLTLDLAPHINEGAKKLAQKGTGALKEIQIFAVVFQNVVLNDTLRLITQSESRYFITENVGGSP